jgi:hypothetical protein
LPTKRRFFPTMFHFSVEMPSLPPYQIPWVPLRNNYYNSTMVGFPYVFQYVIIQFISILCWSMCTMWIYVYIYAHINMFMHMHMIEYVYMYIYICYINIYILILGWIAHSKTPYHQHDQRGLRQSPEPRHIRKPRCLQNSRWRTGARKMTVLRQMTVGFWVFYQPKWGCCSHWTSSCKNLVPTMDNLRSNMVGT